MLIVDHREREIIKELYRRKISFEIKQLITADFIIGYVGIERKTQQDFLNSIIDGRLISQLIELKENVDVPLLIIEGEENIYSLRNMHPNAIRGMLASIAIDYNIPVIYTRNANDTCSLIESIIKRFEKGKIRIPLLKKRKPLTLKERQELIIESFPGIGPTLAKSLLQEFKSVKKIINTNEEKLQKIDKLGPKKASEIKKVIEEEYKD
ncbi:hypothetical protein J4404_01405 [Candidatus Woesearchaeota archaeon]|nr:hypothetical protein [Candidatus Woesearchaeota archaeon]